VVVFGLGELPYPGPTVADGRGYISLVIGRDLAEFDRLLGSYGGGKRAESFRRRVLFGVDHGLSSPESCRQSRLYVWQHLPGNSRAGQRRDCLRVSVP